jgi:hypothetical protein
MQTLQESVDASKEDSGDVIIVDGYSYEILLESRSCAQLKSPPRDSEAGRIAELTRLLDSGSQAWRPWGREDFEAQVLELMGTQ